jgi:hypothetical protein
MTDFISFKGAFSGDLFTPADPGYDDVIGQWTTSLVKRPKIVAFVKNANDIILAIDFAKVNNLPVSVRRGRNAPCEDGLVIDLSRYHDGEGVDPEANLTNNGGSLWEIVDRAAIQHGLATVAGASTVNHMHVCVNRCPA